ncbi:hypothetical protein M405DRAFT_532490 [Rhizopogon salebrosus TDB-379]|nr:hypothetical protein M405DRAFT_532490 [Rhizopogon salebrosus TDB-379]
MCYYHYATAGGAKFWVFTPSLCPAFTHHCRTAEGIPHGIANYPIHIYQHFVYKHFPVLSHLGNCSGSEPAALFGCALLTSYLVHFICARMTYDPPRQKQTGWVRLAYSQMEQTQCSNVTVLLHDA